MEIRENNHGWDPTEHGALRDDTGCMPMKLALVLVIRGQGRRIWIWLELDDLINVLKKLITIITLKNWSHHCTLQFQNNMLTLQKLFIIFLLDVNEVLCLEYNFSLHIWFTKCDHWLKIRSNHMLPIKPILWTRM